jgi:hypothetical protein
MELKLSSSVYYSHDSKQQQISLWITFLLVKLGDSSMCEHVNHDVFQREIFENKVVLLYHYHHHHNSGSSTPGNDWQVKRACVVI